MAIRTISYSVKSDGISPNTEQQAGLQSEHAVTQLVFTLDSTLYQALLSEKSATDTLVYRFDCCDSMGGAVKTEPKTLTGNTVTFTVGENLTRNGGKARVYLVISRYNSAKKTETELLSFPAKLRFENVPETDSDNGNSRESLSTLTEAAKDAADRARLSANAAVEAQGKTEAARLAIEGDSTVIFDGNGTYGEMDVDFVVDTELSAVSDNAIANKAVTKKLSRNLSERYILFVGDSYSMAWTATGGTNSGLPNHCINSIAAALGGVSGDFKSQHYRAIALGGSGFCAQGKDKDKVFKNTYDILKEFIEKNTGFMSKVTDVVFALGYNDASKRAFPGDLTATGVDSVIKENISKCNDIINQNTSHYVNKYLFAVGWGSNPRITYQAAIVYKEVYSYAASLGWVYTDLRYVMYDSALYFNTDDKGKDFVHPNADGCYKIARKIVNTLLGNSDIISCHDKWYTTPEFTYQGKKVKNNIGYLHIVNNDLAQLYLSSATIFCSTENKDKARIVLAPGKFAEVCEIDGLHTFGDVVENDDNENTNVTHMNTVSHVLFHLMDTSTGFDGHVMLGCWITRRYWEYAKKRDENNELIDDKAHKMYKSYLNVVNYTDSEISFTHLAPDKGLINILPGL